VETGERLAQDVNLARDSDFRLAPADALMGLGVVPHLVGDVEAAALPAHKHDH